MAAGLADFRVGWPSSPGRRAASAPSSRAIWRHVVRTWRCSLAVSTASRRSPSSSAHGGHGAPGGVRRRRSALGRRAPSAEVRQLGHVDLLVNNAGYVTHALFKDHDVDDMERMVQTNLLGTIYTMKAVLPSMRARRQGWIVNLSSVAGKLGQPDEAVYSATKFAVAGLSEGISYELEPLGIHVMTVHPALVRTEMFTAEILARMPPRAKRTFIEPPEFTRGVLRALARGRYEVTVPGYVNIAYVIRALLPSLHRRITARLRLPVLPDLLR